MIQTTPSDFGSGFAEAQSDTSRLIFSDEDICGEGATCRVYDCRIDGMRVAVKQLNPDLMTVPIYRASFKKEFLLGRDLRHPALPVYRDFYSGDDEVYIVMDFIDGITLSDFVNTEEGRVYFKNQYSAVHFFEELLSVVGYLHRRGIVHCDIKPENIMLRNTDRGVMIIDLDKSYCDARDRSHGGTAGMSAPLVQGERPTVRKDIEAIGKIAEYLSENVKGFPKRAFRRFRINCQREDATASALEASLNRSSKINYWLIGIPAVCLMGGWLYLSNSDRSKGYEATDASLTAVKDTVILMPSDNKGLSKEDDKETSGLSDVKPGLNKIGEDFDKRMGSFIIEAHRAIDRISSGELSDQEVMDELYRMESLYTSGYQKILSDYKSANPEIPGIDIDLAVARHAERSEASNLRERVGEVCVAIKKERHPELYDDLH